MEKIDFDELDKRGLVKQITDKDSVKELIDTGKAVFYIGIDPTSDSLHVGHLMQLIFAKRLIDLGNWCIFLIGSATAEIGDPSGKSEVRQVLTRNEVTKNANSIKKQILNFFGNPIKQPFEFQDNGVWFNSLSFTNFISGIGSHFSVPRMLNAKCFKSRLENGLTFLEFSYMLMQAFDFLHLHNSNSCNLQVGGDDQWSNILAGIDLNSYKNKDKIHGLTLPLLTNSNGVKMGKTEKGAIFLDKEKTSVFDFFQFWRNLPDEDFKKILPLLATDPSNFPMDINLAKKAFASELTNIVHGSEELEKVLKQVDSMFESKNLENVTTVIMKPMTDILNVLVKCGFAKSKNDARNLITNKAIKFNKIMVASHDFIIPELNDQEFTLSMGKKRIVKIKFGD